MFLVDCTLGKKSNIHSFHFNLLTWKKNISQFFFVENRTFILCKHFFHYSETCQHISWVTGLKRKNAYISGPKSVEIYVVVMGEINLPLIILWDLSLISGKNVWCVSITHMYVASTHRKKNWLLFFNNYWLVVYLFKMNIWPQIKLFYSRALNPFFHIVEIKLFYTLIFSTFWEGCICNGKNHDFNSKIIVQCRLKSLFQIDVPGK